MQELKTLKHILGISHLLLFLAFVALGSIQSLLQNGKNTDSFHARSVVAHKQNTSFEQGAFEIDFEKETEGSGILKTISTHDAVHLASPSNFFRAHMVLNPHPASFSHSRPIFLELHHFRI